MDDDEYYDQLMEGAKQDWQYHDICLWSPLIEDTVDKVAKRMEASGFDKSQPIVLYEGKILDGRHRYLAAVKTGVDPIFSEFQGSREEAVEYVTMKQVERGHWSNPEKEFFYVQRAEALGVRKREDSLKQNSTVPQNCGSVPSAQDHAKALGVSERTVNNWEKDRKEIKADPELSEKAKTFEGYKEAKKDIKARKLNVPDYDVATTLGALKGMAEMFSKRYEGTYEEAASVLFSELIKGCEQDDIGMSIARDYVKWFLNFKEVLDMAQPSLEAFLEDKPNLKLVN